MSSTKSKRVEKDSDAARWQEAIDDAGVMMARADDPERRRRLEAAITWFKRRLREGAPYLDSSTPTLY